MERLGVMDIAVTTEILDFDLPSKIIFTFKRAYKTETGTKKRLCFMGDNGSAYDAREYSLHRGYGPNWLAHRILTEPEGCDYLNPARRGPKPKDQIFFKDDNCEPGSLEWECRNLTPRSEEDQQANLDKIEMRKFDKLVKSRPVKDKNFCNKQALSIQKPTVRPPKFQKGEAGRLASKLYIKQGQIAKLIEKGILVP